MSLTANEILTVQRLRGIASYSVQHHGSENIHMCFFHLWDLQSFCKCLSTHNSYRYPYHRLHVLLGTAVSREGDVWIPEALTQPPVVMLASPPAPAPATQNLGPTLRLSLRTTHVVNGKRSDSTSTDNMTIRRLKPFQQLIQCYQNHHSISPSESRVLFSFDGQRMDPTRNPSFYDLEDEDLIA